MSSPDIRIDDLSPDDEKAVNQTAALLIKGFREHNPESWPDMESARQEVNESFEQDRISRVAIDEEGNVIGWIGGIHHHHYRGRVWELHPVVVEPSRQRQGIGRALVEDLEERIKERGGVIIYLGADDENNMTSVAGINLYPNVLEHLLNIKNIKGHPYEFYQKMGYTIVGIMPDANGPGQPDIHMAKRVGNNK